MDNFNVFEDCRASQNKEELKWLLTILSEKPRSVVLEIGTWRGYSMEVWYKALAPSFLLTIENDRETLEFLNGRQARGEFRYMQPKPVIIPQNSFDSTTIDYVKNMLGDKTIDFLFIDGNHTYDAVKKDFEGYLPLMSQGGIIGFHDVGLEGEKWDQAGVQVKKFFDEIKEKYKHAVYQGETGTGTGVLYL